MNSHTALLLHEPIPTFGARHSSEKLEVVSAYAKAYTTALKKQKFEITYIDAFAGAGYFRPRSKTESNDQQLAFEQFRDEGLERFVLGSSRRALMVEPPFSRYVFIEKNQKYAEELETLKEDFPDKANQILIRAREANGYLQEICAKDVWRNRRALVFLDPFGMEVEWSTIEAIARTQAIDLWYLFPTGIGINRLLNNDGIIESYNQLKLDSVFGTSAWRSVFYKVSKQGTLFTQNDPIVKVADYNLIERFFVDRLKSIFAGVADKPYRLYNNKGVWLYSMCFAAGNPTGKTVALRIANHILSKKPWQQLRR